ncbi:peptide ABC transporter substrate-binding protein [Brevibacillus laterosporus]|uniref:Peptide ABC transporter substrate-binding protein n=1 Tax=Brevibacillus laterosporus TaxID=1465 RepID=A0A502H958_BRELA|nr:peptide ABC transporter substrate-binding protein [Brevibacillus laterosporus]QDX92305.1 peptide ABC transporter substrate-binding protein [Brevibacillus laterosporus]TPG70614.1 peptide ABC transporter substrate-binding protein [Brevibacillus laterosporus]TPG80241.1 peptide ABC transporter substrate-binding protein [Brevibacillus laterosporus]
MKKNIFVLMSSVLVLGTALAGCGTSNGNGAAPANNESKKSEDSKAGGNQSLHLNLASEPPTLDPGLTEDATSGAIVRSTFDGLTRVGEDGKPHNSVAADIKISDDLKTYTFTLRDSKWSNGEPVTAKDYEYAWKRVLTPKTAASYAYQLYYIKGAEAYHKNKGKLEDVGVKALDDKTLEVTLENPTPFFLELTAFYTYYPVNQKLDTANPDWAKDAKTHLGNGPFKLDTWEHKSKIVLTKNENYWDKDSVKMEKIEFSMIDDGNTELSMFDNGDLDWAGKPVGDLPTDAVPIKKADGSLKVKPTASIYWYKFNTEKAPFTNAKIRKAFAYAMDRKAIVDNITQAGERPAMGILPPTMAIKPEGYFKDNDADTAKKLLDEGMKELGISKLPPITLSFNTLEGNKKIAEAIQDQWKKNLNVDVRLENTEWKVYIDRLHQGSYQIGRMAWSADFNDPINFLEQYRDKKGGNNDTNWENAKYKELLIKSASETDPAKRTQLFAEAEQIIMDEMPVIPIYYRTQNWIQNEKVKGVFLDALGFVDYKWSYIAE